MVQHRCGENKQTFFGFKVLYLTTALHPFPSLSRPIIQPRCWKKGWLKYSPDLTGGGVGAGLLLGWDEL